ncbi:hypothetical protein HYS97_01070, partial [Candidatus Daviesbacteria bacterium]|nr:hypothetical protein [Candidatus Daviesbacteria bacterium]
MPKINQLGLAPIAVILIIAVIGVGLYLTKPWEKFDLPFGQLLQIKVPEAIQPNL